MRLSGLLLALTATLLPFAASELEIAPTNSTARELHSAAMTSCMRVGPMGIDIPGGDYASAPARDYLECGLRCKNDNACNAFAYADGVCYLKRIGGFGVAKDNVISGIRFKSFDDNNFCPVEYLIVLNCDIVGNDAGNFPGKFDECVAKIEGYYFTWSDYNGGTCWKKNKHNPLKCNYAARISSGVRMDANLALQG